MQTGSSRTRLRHLRRWYGPRELAGRVFRIGHLGSLTEGLALSAQRRDGHGRPGLGRQAWFSVAARRHSSWRSLCTAEGRMMKEASMCIPTLKTCAPCARIIHISTHPGADLAHAGRSPARNYFSNARIFRKPAPSRPAGPAMPCSVYRTNKQQGRCDTFQRQPAPACLCGQAARIPCTVVMRTPRPRPRTPSWDMAVG